MVKLTVVLNSAILILYFRLAINTINMANRETNTEEAKGKDTNGVMFLVEKMGSHIYILESMIHDT